MEKKEKNIHISMANGIELFWIVFNVTIICIYSNQFKNMQTNS